MSAARLLLALDAGTTGVRAIVFDAQGRQRGAAYEELEVSCPHPGWVEADPAMLWQATRRVMAAALRASGAGSAEVAAVGIANQRASTIVWERATGQPAHPCIVWQDTRTAARVAELVRSGHFGSTMLSSTKIEWLLQHIDRGRQRAEKGELCFGTVDTWLAWNLTGGRAHLTDPSNASCSGLYDFGAGAWDAGALDLFQIPAAMLPEIVPSSGLYGSCNAQACGISAPVAALAGDQQASMFGLLRHRRGDFKVTFGTSAMVDVNTGDWPVISRRGAYPLVLWQIGSTRQFCLEGTAITAGAAVQWLRDGLGVIVDARDTEALARGLDDSGGVWVVPAFQGLGTPYMDTDARALIGGLSRASTPAHIVRATLEGIAFRCREIIEALAADLDTDPPPLLRVDGGAAENDFLLQHLSNVLGVPVERPATVQGTALGAALLAGLGIGMWSDLAEIDQFWSSGATFEPTWNASRRDQEFARWRTRVTAALETSSARLR